LIRILVIEDEPRLREAVARMLHRAGYDVIQAANGAEGLALWRERGADLVMTDIQMPEKNGIEVVLELRAFAPTVPVIAMSGGSRSRDLDLLGDMKLLGTVGLLQKPFSYKELMTTVAAALKSKRSPDQEPSGDP
jgi:DNA-binding response OmpR family regulator